jgi:hypothetical protein
LSTKYRSVRARTSPKKLFASARIGRRMNDVERQPGDLRASCQAVTGLPGPRSLRGHASSPARRAPRRAQIPGAFPIRRVHDSTRRR